MGRRHEGGCCQCNGARKGGAYGTAKGEMNGTFSQASSPGFPAELPGVYYLLYVVSLGDTEEKFPCDRTSKALIFCFNAERNKSVGTALAREKWGK